MSNLSHVVAAVYDRPWLILPGTLAAIAEVVEMHVAGNQLSAAEIQARLDVAAAANGPRRGARVHGSVGVIPIYGVIMPRATLMTEMSGGTSVAGIRAAFREALADESIGSIVLDIDSPGGYVDGIEELAAEIRAPRAKSVTAIADYGAASAAYWIASAADEIVASPSGMVGSIGAVVIHQEFSRADDLEGITTTILRQPPLKAEGNPYEPLSDAAKTYIQDRVDEVYGQFVAAVAKGRGVSASVVRSQYGEGRMLSAQRAKAAGLVDRVETLDATIQRVASGRGPLPRGTSAADHLGAGVAAAAAATLEGIERGKAAAQGGDATPADDPEAVSSGEAGTPPDRSIEAAAAVALARARIR